MTIRYVDVDLEDFPPTSIPAALALGVTTVQIDLKELAHHLLLATDGYSYSDLELNPYLALTIRKLIPDIEFLLQPGGIATDTEMKNAQSTQYGRATLRWFLTKYCGASHFASISKIAGKDIHLGSGLYYIDRLNAGDMPDYLTVHRNRVRVAEAKGRTGKLIVQFTHKVFVKWDQQLSNILVIKNAKFRRLKGYIVVANFLVAAAKAARSRILVKDPETPGEEPLDDDSDFAGFCARIHYGEIFLRCGFIEFAMRLLGAPDDGYREEFRLSQHRFDLAGIQDRNFVRILDVPSYFPSRYHAQSLFIDQKIFSVLIDLANTPVSPVPAELLLELRERYSTFDFQKTENRRSRMSFLPDGTLFGSHDDETYEVSPYKL